MDQDVVNHAGEGRGVSGATTRNRMYEPLASPLDCERHIFVVLAKKAAKAGIGERENDESGERRIVPVRGGVKER